MERLRNLILLLGLTAVFGTTGCVVEDLDDDPDIDVDIKRDDDPDVIVQPPSTTTTTTSGGGATGP
jgi:hypothetical protein